MAQSYVGIEMVFVLHPSLLWCLWQSSAVVLNHWWSMTIMDERQLLLIGSSCELFFNRDIDSLQIIMKHNIWGWKGHALYQLKSKPASAFIAYNNFCSSCSLLYHGRVWWRWFTNRKKKSYKWKGFGVQLSTKLRCTNKQSKGSSWRGWESYL